MHITGLFCINYLPQVSLISFEFEERVWIQCGLCVLADMSV